jgi:hypothetical protein
MKDDEGGSGESPCKSPTFQVIVLVRMAATLFQLVMPHLLWLNYASSFNVIEHRLRTVLLLRNDMQESARCMSRLRPAAFTCSGFCSLHGSTFCYVSLFVPAAEEMLTSRVHKGFRGRPERRQCNRSPCAIGCYKLGKGLGVGC